MNNDVFDIRKVYRTIADDVYIDIQIDYYSEIYNEWDFSPLASRDLDDDLYEYLEICAREIPKKYNINIVFHIPELIRDKEKEEKSFVCYRNFFSYRLRRLDNKLKTLHNRMVKNGVFGVILILSAILADKFLTSTILTQFLIEGLSIGGWVLFWELFSTLFFSSSELRETKSILERLRRSKIIYRYRIEDTD